MKKYLLAAALFLPIYCAIVVCCTPSLHPLYTDEDIIFDEALIGLWQAEDSGDTSEITRMGNEDAYNLVYTDEDGVPGNFIVHLVMIEETMFLDVFPVEIPDTEMNDLYAIHILGAHTFVLVEQIEPTLRIRDLDPEWLESFLEENPEAIAHDTIEEDTRLIFTASTEELQAFMIEHLDTEGAYGEAIELLRVEEAPDEVLEEGDVESAEAVSD